MVRFFPGIDTYSVLPAGVPGGTCTRSIGCPNEEAIGDADRGKCDALICRRLEVLGIGEMVVSWGPTPTGTACANGSCSKVGGGMAGGSGGGGARGVTCE